MRDPFEYHKPSREQMDRIDRIRAVCREVRDTIVTQCKTSRQTSVAMTKLEEVMHWAVKAIVMEESE